ncbi:integrase fusion protein [Mycolicibacterium flavescens]|uniref:tyrosine-type recombinase/integrase n=1 Tax=Mycobacterium neumannii TaxID=2048551 RepID=UPI000B93B1FF|nr:site-specific integrase [Mycobacterium neumannii]VEG40436.1 integrase fusion protein [Mycolicibacterium flavescens]
MAQRRNRRSGVEDRWRKADGTPSASDGKGNRWRARYVDEQGREHARGFTRKVAAQRWLDEVTAAVVTGQYVDPKAGQVTFRDYAERWRGMQVQRPSSRAHIETMLRRHAYPVLGDRPLSSILPSDIQAWVKGLELAPATIGVVHGVVSTIMKAAIRDRRIVANPCDGSKLPKVERKQVVPLTTEQVAALREGLPPQLQALVTLAAGTGMRQGECLGLTVDRVKFLERTVTVDRQLVTVPGQPPSLGPPKTQASNRTIPLPQVVVDALAAHLAAFPAASDGLLFTLSGKPITRQAFGHKWRPAVARTALPTGTGFHTLRHYYASLLIRHGESVKTVQARLGHASAVETLDTYSHLWPDSDDRTRDAVDSVLGVAADALRTAAAPLS